MGIRSPGHGRFCSAMVDSHTAYREQLFPGEARRNNPCDHVFYLSSGAWEVKQSPFLDLFFVRPRKREIGKLCPLPIPFSPPPFIHTWTELRRLFATCSPFYFSSLMRQKCGAGGLTSFRQINDLRPPFSHTFSIVLQTQRTHKKGKFWRQARPVQKKVQTKKVLFLPLMGLLSHPRLFSAFSPH